MNLERLKFAWARGARVQITFDPAYACPRRWATYFGSMQQVERIWPRVRIHPDDEHLQYGPLSTVIRRAAIDEIYADQDPTYLAAQALYTYEMHTSATLLRAPAAIDRRMMLLFFAEYLADQGL